MKKTLVALAVTAFAASASAVTLYNDNGTQVDFNGSLRMIMEEAGSKTKYSDGTKSGTTHSYLRNAGSRIGMSIKHNIADDFYAFGRTELRFDGVNSGKDKFGDIYAKRAYMGLGSKQFGEITFGRQVTIADDMGISRDYEYGLVPKGNYITTAATSVIRYDYKGIEGLQVGLNYNFSQDRSEKGATWSRDLQTRNEYGLGILYTGKVAEDQAFIAKFGYGHTNFERTSSNNKHHRDGFILSLGYKFGPVTIYNESGYKHVKKDNADTNSFYVVPGFIYQYSPVASIYGNYLYEYGKRDKTEGVSDTTWVESKSHGFLLGADYKPHKQVVLFVEGKYVRSKNFYGVNKATDVATTSTSYALNSKTGEIEGTTTTSRSGRYTDDKAIGVGMRVFW